MGALMSAEELEQLYIPNKSVELVRGHLVVREPSGFLHATVAARLIRHLSAYAEQHDLGVVTASEGGFRIFSNPDTVLAPDAAYIAKSRLPKDTRSFPRLAPDIVAEVLSPRDRKGEIEEKVSDWLAAGSQLVWVIDPVARNALVHRRDGSSTALAEHDELSGENVLTGFAVPLRLILG